MTKKGNNLDTIMVLIMIIIGIPVALWFGNPHQFTYSDSISTGGSEYYANFTVNQGWWGLNYNCILKVDYIKANSTGFFKIPIRNATSALTILNQSVIVQDRIGNKEWNCTVEQ